MEDKNITPLSVIISFVLLSAFFYAGFTLSEKYQAAQDPQIETKVQLSQNPGSGGEIKLKVTNNTNVDELQLKVTGMEFKESIKHSIYEPNKSDEISLTTSEDGVSPSGQLVVKATNNNNEEIIRARTYDLSD